MPHSVRHSCARKKNFCAPKLYSSFYQMLFSIFTVAYVNSILPLNQKNNINQQQFWAGVVLKSGTISEVIFFGTRL